MSDQSIVVPNWNKMPLKNEWHYKSWWENNCRNCIKSSHRENGNECDLEDVLCRASVAIHGMGGRTPSDEVRDLLGGGYATQEIQEICDRLRINQSSLPWNCPEKTT
jgi:hypothetical protein